MLGAEKANSDVSRPRIRDEFTDSKELINQLRQLAVKYHYEIPGHFNRLRPNQLTRQGGITFLKQYAHFARTFPRLVAIVTGLCLELDVRQHLILDLFDEEVKDDNAGTYHYDLLLRMARALGATNEEIDQAEPLPLVRVGLLALENAVRSRGWIEGVGALAALEMINHPDIRKECAEKGWSNVILDYRMWKHLGLTDEDLKYRLIHTEGGADKVHVERGLKLLAKHADLEYVQGKVLEAASDALISYRTVIDTAAGAALGS